MFFLKENKGGTILISTYTIKSLVYPGGSHIESVVDVHPLNTFREFLYYSSSRSSDIVDTQTQLGSEVMYSTERYFI